ncbi:MAG: DUF362 domain-containing protein [Firmicutes bacterium]|jgi:uncharacterized protein (DUF362 family)|nr:DUF362 domain-containing protein [Bacillota bacterium]NLO66560.1 DUF362 domain-containing protein [Bacillota bacterium]
MLRNELLISYGQRPREMVKEILDTIKLAEGVPAGSRVGLKPNLVVARPAWEGATTSPDLVAGVLEYLLDHGFRDLVIAEGSWIGDSTARAFRACGYTDLAERYGVELVDLQRDSYHTRRVEDLELLVCDEMSRIDYLINLPVLKGHCQTRITCALKNLKGCIPDREKRRFHTLGLHTPIAALNKAIHTNLVVVDGFIGDLDFEEGGNPVQMDRVIVGTDPVLVDSYVAALLGYGVEDVPYITLAAELGVGELYSEKTTVRVINDSHTTKRIEPSRSVEHLAKHIDERDACSACFGSLIHALARLNEKGQLQQLTQKVAIGQGFKGVKQDGLGAGSCTRGFSRHVPGCPPTAKDVLDFLYDNLG